tara:strand:+ start:1942 stop:2574 length:633 start_codon:yes stop_codon:yes gene_type:complete
MIDMSINYKKLIISPHVDDDVLGCGGILDSDSFVLYCGLDESEIPNRPSKDKRIIEIKSITDITYHGFKILDNRVNQYIEYDLIREFERVINNIKPDEVYLPYPSYNQDHRAAYDAALVALRPHDINYFVKRVFIYEQPHMLFWDNSGSDFKPNYFISIDIDRKVNLYKLMKSQVRSFRDVKHVRAISKLRGGQSNYKYAEAFQILRWVD